MNRRGVNNRSINQEITAEDTKNARVKQQTNSALQQTRVQDARTEVYD